MSGTSWLNSVALFAGGIALVAGSSPVIAGPIAPTAGVPVIRYEAGALPSGFSLCAAGALPEAQYRSQRRRSSWNDGYPMQVWADMSRADPWNGPVAVVSTRPPDPGWKHEDARPIRINGRPAEISSSALVVAPEGGFTVTMRRRGGGIVEVSVPGASARRTIAVSRALAIEARPPRLPLDALGRETRVISRSPRDVAVSFFAPFRWTVIYATGPIGDPAVKTITISDSPATANAFSLGALLAADYRLTTLAGRPSLEYAQFDRRRGPFGIGFRDAAGQILNVRSIGLSRQEVRRVAESLRPIDADRWPALTQPSALCSR